MTAMLNTHEFKAKLSEFLGRVAFARERLVVTRHGKPIAALVPMDDLRRLEKMDADSPSESERPKQHPLMAVYGAWADSPEMDEIFEEILRERHNTPPRDTYIWD